MRIIQNTYHASCIISHLEKETVKGKENQQQQDE